jgi:hypothetical protein
VGKARPHPESCKHFLTLVRGATSIMRLLAAGVQTVQCKVGRKVNNVMRERKREREQWREKERERERKTKRERKRKTQRERERENVIVRQSE